ncbi:hypothetical protein [Luteibacter sp. 22Crub2.1]|uniref:hypothetical protein n=1 Tax=Luteibacter sp. 22Crub2.1 TaxID=1283288 RepID=UPI0009A91578|nr:hypothetical protein [Luteibacter sp. 22Crub2.1]
MAIAFALLAANTSSNPDASVFASDESLVFSCRFKSRKTVSISRSSANNDDYTTFRYGSPGQPEITHHAKNNKKSDFYYAMLADMQAIFFEFGFVNDGSKYSLIRDWYEGVGEPSYLLRVVGMEPREGYGLQLRCADDIVDNGLTDQRSVRCDVDMKPGCDDEDNEKAGYPMKAPASAQH